MIPLQIQYRDFPESEAVSANIWDAVADLEKFDDRIISCHVTIGRPHRSKTKGRIYHIQIRLHVPGSDIVINREPEMNHAHEDIDVAIRDAFVAAKRRLEEFVRIQRGHIKTAEGPAHAKIEKIFPIDEYGFLITSDGREIYFHKNSVVGTDFANLDVGQEVRFKEEMGEKGPQASSLNVVGKSGKESFF